MNGSEQAQSPQCNSLSNLKRLETDAELQESFTLDLFRLLGDEDGSPPWASPVAPSPPETWFSSPRETLRLEARRTRAVSGSPIGRASRADDERLLPGAPPQPGALGHEVLQGPVLEGRTAERVVMMAGIDLDRPTRLQRRRLVS